MIVTRVNTVVVEGGQAALSVSHYLTQHAVGHVVLEQADLPGDAWRSHRWDSFTLNTPRWQSRVIGVRYGEDGLDGFMPKQEVVAHLKALASRLPVRTRARVASIARNKRGDYVVTIEGGFPGPLILKSRPRAATCRRAIQATQRKPLTSWRSSATISGWLPCIQPDDRS